MNIHSLTRSNPLLASRLAIAACAVLSLSDVFAESKPSPSSRVAPASQTPSPPAEGTEPKPLDQSIEAGLAFLLKQQHDGGGWGQGGGWRTSGTRDAGGARVEGKEIEDPADLGNTCVGLMALLRAGSNPAAGAHKEPATKAFEFICRQVEKSDDTSLYVTPVRDTQLQSKIGQYVDTFLAGWTLSELKGRVPEELEKRRSAALDKVVAKIEKNQKENGAFDGNAGWASVLSQGLCSKALNGAARSGAKVSQEALAKDQRQNEEGLNLATASFSAPTATEPSSAGVDLYRQAAKLGGLWEKNVTNQQSRRRAEEIVADAKAPEPEKAKARADIERFTKEDKAAQVATKAVGGSLGNAKFIAGFGNNGGEEFLSYLTIAEALHANGGKEWEDWKTKASLTIRSAQNADGGWSGHHCITGRTFCTGTALLVLTVGRDPGAGVAKVTVPAAAADADTVKAEAVPAINTPLPARNPALSPAQEPKQEPTVAPLPPAAPAPSASVGQAPSQPVTQR